MKTIKTTFQSIQHKKRYYDNLLNILYGCDNRDNIVFKDGNSYNLNKDNIILINQIAN
jgi:hypothetical protein